MQFFARLRSRKKKGGSRLLRYGWKVTLLILLAGAGFAIFLFYGTWAQTFDMKNVGEMPERNTVYDVDGKIYSRLRSEEHTSELQSPDHLVCRLLLEKKKRQEARAPPRRR